MNIQWMGGSGFRLRSGGITVHIDPPAGTDDADIIAYTDPSETDAALSLVGSRPFRIAGPGEYEVRGIFVIGVPLRRPQGQRRDSEGQPRPPRVGFAIEADGVAVGLLGSAAVLPSQDEVEALGHVDVLIVSVGDSCLKPDEAAELTAQVEPSIVIPIAPHEKIEGEPTAVARFQSEMGVEGADQAESLSVAADRLPVETKVVLLKPVA